MTVMKIIKNTILTLLLVFSSFVILKAENNIVQLPSPTLSKDTIFIEFDELQESGVFDFGFDDGVSLFESATSDNESFSQDSFSSLSGFSFNGYARGSILGGGKQYDLASSFAEIALQPSYSKGVAMMKSDIRLRRGLFFEEDKQIIEIKELFTGYKGDKFDFFIGNQIVNWGRTDGFNPTNNITPNDFFFLTAEPDDQKMSNFLLRMKYRISPAVEIDLIGIPYFKPSNYRFDLFDLNEQVDLGELPIQLPDFDINVDFNPLLLPKRKLENGSFAARINVELPEIDFSLSYFSGYDPYHGFDLKDFEINIFDSKKPIQISYEPKVYTKNTFGFDFALPLSSSMLRGEAAFNLTRRKNNEIYIPKSDFSYVLGYEKIWNDFVFLAQYISKVTPDFEAISEPLLDFSDFDINNFDITKIPNLMEFPEDMVKYESAYFNRMIFNQQKKFNHAFSFTLNRPFKYEEWNAEFTAYYNLTSKELMLRPKLNWKITDALNFAFGASYMKAYDKSLFYFSSTIMNGAFAELKIGF